MQRTLLSIREIDEDAGDPLTLRATTLPAWLAFEDNGDGTALLSGIPEVADVGEHDVTLRASDGAGGTAEQSFTITVKAQEPAEPPASDSELRLPFLGQ